MTDTATDAEIRRQLHAAVAGVDAPDTLVDAALAHARRTQQPWRWRALAVAAVAACVVAAIVVGQPGGSRTATPHDGPTIDVAGLSVALPAGITPLTTQQDCEGPRGPFPPPPPPSSPPAWRGQFYYPLQGQDSLQACVVGHVGVPMPEAAANKAYDYPPTTGPYLHATHVGPFLVYRNAVSEPHWLMSTYLMLIPAPGGNVEFVAMTISGLADPQARQLVEATIDAAYHASGTPIPASASTNIA